MPTSAALPAPQAFNLQFSSFSGNFYVLQNGYLANPHVAFLPNPSMPSEVAPHPAVQSVAPPTDCAYVPESQMDDETIYRRYILNIHD